MFLIGYELVYNHILWQAALPLASIVGTCHNYFIGYHISVTTKDKNLLTSIKTVQKIKFDFQSNNDQGNVTTQTK